ncbi:DMT family transporter [Streptomyces sp. CMB-StM0423]|uniref:DMT family transporter n=1 Tax=Streptomyces sp. CMB-StM0423 TaxID=2059884 RepID=UPI001F224423|nr:DMT family transporter [Streptomyces sp. CMB-StM0423]
MSPLMLSVLLSLVSAVAYAGAALVQERVAATTTDGAGGLFAPLHRGSWWASVVLNTSGALLHVVALAYGPLSLVQPLGALTIVFALPMAAIFFSRRAGRAAWRGALLSTVGLVVLLMLVDPVESRELGGTTALALAVASVGVLAVLTLVGTRIRHVAARSVTLAVASGAAFGMASVFTKDVTADFMDPLAIGMIAILAPAGLLLSQAAYRGAGLSAPLATLTVVNPVIAAAVGVTALGETVRYGALGALLAIGAGVVAAAGLIELTVQAHRTPPEEPAGEPATGTAAAPADGAVAPVTGRVPAPAAPPEPVAPADPAGPAPVLDGPGAVPGSVPAPTPAYHAGAAAAAALYETAPAAEAGPEALGPDGPGTDASRTGVSEAGRAQAAHADAAHAGGGRAGTGRAGAAPAATRGGEPRTSETPAPHTPAPETPAPRVPAPENAAPAGPSPAVAALIVAGAAASGGAALAPHPAGCSRLSGPPGPRPATTTGTASSAGAPVPVAPASAAPASVTPGGDTEAVPPPCCATAVPWWPHAPHRRDRLRSPRRGAGRVLDGGPRGGAERERPEPGSHGPGRTGAAGTGAGAPAA